MSAWAEQPSGGSPAGARSRPASALPLQKPCTSQADDAGCVSQPEKLFWTPPKQWMQACMDKGMPLRRKGHSCAGRAAPACIHLIASYAWPCGMSVLQIQLQTRCNLSSMMILMSAWRRWNSKLHLRMLFDKNVASETVQHKGSSSTVSFNYFCSKMPDFLFSCRLSSQTDFLHAVHMVFTLSSQCKKVRSCCQCTQLACVTGLP